MTMGTMRSFETRMQEPVTVLIAVTPGRLRVDPALGTVDSSGHPSPVPSVIDLLGRVTSGAQAVDRVLEAVPDVLVLDTRIDDLNARDVCRQVQHWAPATRILAVSAHDDELLYATIAAGASSAIVGEPIGPRVADGAERLTRGESLLPVRSAQRLLNDIDAWSRRSSDPLHPPPALTSTEREVLGHLGSGADPAQIAVIFGVTSHLVNVHAGYAVAKLHRYLIGAEHLVAVGG